MKGILHFIPFIILTLISFGAHWINGGYILGNAWAAAFLACVLSVPVLSRRKLWLGYAGLLYPFALFTLFAVSDWGSLSMGF